MAKFNFNNGKKASSNLAPCGADHTFSVSNVREWDNGVTFSLTIDNLVQIHGCRVATKRNGECFVSMPSRKGSNGKYYGHVYVNLPDDSHDVILVKVQDELNKGERS